MTKAITDPDVIKDIYQLEHDYVQFIEKCKQGGVRLDLSEWLPKFRVCRPLVPGELFVVLARTKHGKCLGKGTQVMMSDATTKAVEDIQEGEQVMGPDSQPRTVLTVTRGVDDLYEVTGVDGSRFVCNKEHILCLSTVRDNIEISVKDYLKSSGKFKHEYKAYRSGLEFNKKGCDAKVNKRNVYGITVTPIGRGEYFGFELSGDGLFLLGDFTVTHNSAILQNIARTAAPLKVLYFSLELPGTLMYERQAAMHVRKGQEVIEQFYTEGHMLDTEQLMEMSHIYTCELSRLTPEQIVQIIHIFKRRVGQNPELVIVDYTGLMNSEVNKARYERTSDAIQELKRIAKQEDLIVGCACQVTVGKDDDPELYMGCSRDSRDIENSAGLTIGAWRDPADKDILWTKVLLQTKGPSGDKWQNKFDGEKMLITPEEPDWAYQGDD